jgi:hypothetical protein
MAVKVFIHICAINHIADVLREIVTCMHMSGLYADAERIYCYIAGEPNKIEWVVAFLRRSGKRFHIVQTAPGDTSYERLTLEDAHRHITPDDQVLYIHTKGVSKARESQQTPFIKDWVYMMEYFLIGRYRECLAHLETVDTVGVNYRAHPPHWSGNWWWVRGDYFLKLPHKIGSDYFDPELKFLFTMGARHYEIYGSQHHDHYKIFWEPIRFVP